MFAWGSTAHGELGLGGIEAEHISEPRRLDWFLSDKITDAALGDCHTLFLTNDGTVYSCGSNDHGQLGHTQPRKRPRMSVFKLVTGLEAHHITRVACGEAHSLALTQWGQILSWGSDSQGQCGHQLDENGVLTTPKIIKAISMYHVVQIACGRRHSVALTNAGEVLTWGENTFGQLGLGSKNNIIRVPTLVQSINGIPIAYITCGGFHTFFLSKSGAVYSCGKNQHGQLGLNHTSDMCYPYQLRTLRNIRVRYICCGDEFSAFLTLDGGVFTCGAGYYGQLGHGTNSNEILPRQVAELMGSTITQISCGRQHTLSFIPSRGRVYSFGLGGAGQLGLSHRKIALTPQVVLGPWASPSGSTLFPTEQQNVMIVKVFAGGDHCFVTVIKRTEDGQPYDCRIYDPSTQILVIEEKKLLDAMKISSSKSVDQELLAYFETVFKSLSCFNGSFLKSQESHYYCCSKNHGIDLEFAETTFSLIGKWEHQGLKDVIWNCIIDGIIGELKPNPPDVETLRVYLTLPLYHEFYNPKHHLRLHKPFAKALLGLNRQPLRVVSTWLESTNPDYFEHLVQKFKTVISFILSGMTIPSNGTVPYDASLVAMLDMLALLNKLNNGTNGLKVPYETFHLNELGDFLDIRVDYVVWLHESSSSNKLLLCNYPFIFDAQTKTRLLETDQTLQMQNAMHNATQQALMSLIFESMAHRSGTVEVNQFLKLEVSRENIVEDALQELDKVRVEDLKKPLKVKFKGEEAEDAGGVSKEFFMLLLRQILHPNYGMFKEYEETRALWFCSYNFLEEAVHYYMLIGMVVGLAIYNFTIINLPFPLALYKKLLQEPIVLSDLRALSPSIAKSLEQILEYNEPDFQEVYCLDFVVSQDELGEVRTVPLKPNGENIPVTLENKVEYVNAYVDYVLNASVNKQFKAFQIGFMKVMSGRVLRLFHSQELMAVVIGNEHYDWHALEEATKYKNGYKSSDETIRWFWEVIHEMSLEDKKKFLLFLTGSDRIPIQGMKAIQIEIQPTTDEKFLPVAHTCFNLLDLPRYKTKERLRYKLMQAIQQFEGFSLV